MKKYFVAIVTIVTIVVSFILGTIYGFNQGVDNYYRLDSIPKALIYSTQYYQLKENNIPLVQGYQNIQIDYAIDNYIWYKNNGNHMLTKLLLKEHTNNIDSYIKQLVLFRKNVPTDDISNILTGDSKLEYVNKLKARNDFINK